MCVHSIGLSLECYGDFTTLGFSILPPVLKSVNVVCEVRCLASLVFSRNAIYHFLVAFGLCWEAQ